MSRTEESQQAMLKERLDEEERLKDALEKLQDELSNQKLIAEANLKSSLEQWVVQKALHTLYIVIVALLCVLVASDFFHPSVVTSFVWV